MGGGTRSAEAGKPSSTVERSRTKSGLEAVAFCTSDQVTDCREARAQAQDACREFSTVVAAS